MTGARTLHTATQLNTGSNGTTSGMVLIAGGLNGSTSQNTAQLYSPTAGTWTAAANLNAARHFHSATLLADGRVLVAGGLNGTTILQTAALYNPASGTGTWTATTGPIPPPGLKNHAAVLLTTSNNQLANKVLLIGGNNGTSTVSSVFLFDPTQSAFSTLTALSSPREGHTATTLPNGNILITGGKNGSTVLATTMLFNPSSSNGTWSSAGTMTTARQLHAAVLLPSGIVENGQVLVAGGNNGASTLGTAELWNGTSIWTATSALPAPVQSETATVLPNNMVLIAGGVNGSTTVATADLYDASFALACTSNSQCATGFCVNGVCCDTACNGGCGVCNLSGKVGTCSPASSTTVCRAQNGACDVAEKCSGTSLTCPVDAVAPLGTVCRAQNGICDVAETCDGMTKACPTDGFAPATTVCHPSTGTCDATVTCTGKSASCPPDTFAPAGTVCRPSAGGCDVAETCTGNSSLCPADSVAPAGSVCRPAESICDVAETCNGTSSACPTNTFAAAGTACGAATNNSSAPVCSGMTGTCPVASGTSDILGFEAIGDWAVDSSDSGGTTIVGLNSNRTQGASSLEVTAQGSARFNSAPMSSLGGVGPLVLLDILLPTSQANPSSFGDAQMFVNSPTLGLFNVALSDVPLTGLALGIYQTLAFQMPTSVTSAIASGIYADLTFSVVLNVNPTETGHYLLDNIRSIPDVVPSLLGVAQDGSTLKAIFDYQTTSSTPVNISYGTANGLANQNGFVTSPPEVPPTTFVSTTHAPFVATLSGSLLTWTVGSHTVTATPSSQQLPVTAVSGGTHDALLEDGRKVNLDATPPAAPTAQSEPPIGTVFPGALNGTFGTTPTGAATYTLPLTIPPGIAGMAPNLALNYNSQGADGLAGQGFSLSGTSVIHRCPTTHVQDGTVTSEGGFCLDGKRLFDRGTTTLPDATQVRIFEPEAQDYTVIRQFTNSDNSLYFTITTKDGQTRYYGARSTGDSRVLVTNPSNTVIWLLDRVMDQWGNYYDIHYNNDQGNAAGSFNSGGFNFLTTGICPTSIAYTGHASQTLPTTSPFYTIKFSYQDRTDFRSVRFGFTTITQSVLLQEMDIYNTADQSAPLQTYTLTYVNDGNITLPSRLNTVQYCPRAGACLPAISFGWQGGGYTWSEDTSLALPGPIEQIGSQNGDQIGLSYTTAKTHGTKLIDLDGDGLPDFVRALNGAPATAYRNNGLTWTAAPSSWNLPASLANSDGTSTGAFFIDVDGDGLLDFVANGPTTTICSNGSSIFGCTSSLAFTPQIWLNRLKSGQGWVPDPDLGALPGVQFTAVDFTQHDTMADMDGDGRADLVRFGPGDFDVNVFINGSATGAGWSASSQNFQVPNGIECEQPADGTQQTPPDACYHLEDVNRDGLTDLVAATDALINKGQDVNGTSWQVEQAGHGDPAFANPGTPGLSSRGDVDGDGLYDSLFESVDQIGSGDDIISFGPVNISFAFATGLGFTSSNANPFIQSLGNAISGAPTNFVPNTEFVDVNADGLADIVLGHPDGGQVLFNSGAQWLDLYGRTSWPSTAGVNPMPAIPSGTAGVAMVDMNGDGVPDLVQSTCGGTSVDCNPSDLVVHTWINQFQPATITQFPSGIAQNTVVDYMSITSPFAGLTLPGMVGPTYSDTDTSPVFGTTFLALPMRVAWQVTADDGNGGQARKVFQYTSLRGSAFGRGPQGFRTVIETDFATKTKSTTQYAQAYPYTGLPIAAGRSANTGTLGSLVLNATNTVYCDVPNFDPSSGQDSPCTSVSGGPSVPGTSTFVYPLAVADRAFLRADVDDDVGELLGTNLTKTTFIYNSQGNPTQTSVEQDYPTGETFLRTTKNFYEFNIDGRIDQLSKITKTTVTSQRTAPVDNNNAPITHTTTFSYTEEVGATGAPNVNGSPDFAVALFSKDVEPDMPAPIRQKTAFDYDEFGNVTTTTGCASDFNHCAPGATTSDPTPFRTTTVTYDPAMFNAPVGAGLTSSLSYGPGRFPVKSTNALQQVSYSAFDPVKGKELQTTGIDGIHTCFTYDDIGRESSETDRCGSSTPLTTTITRSFIAAGDDGGTSASKVVTITRPPSGAATWNYGDVLGRSVGTRGRSFDGGVIETFSIYDSAGRLGSTTKPFEDGDTVYSTTYGFDALNRPKETLSQLGQIGASGQATASTVSHFLGTTIKTDRSVNGQDEVRQEVKNALGKTDSVVDALNGTIHYAYDADGNLTDAGDAQNHTIPTVHTQYDLRGRKSQTADPDVGTWNYTYDGFGDLVSQTDANGQTVTMTYDVLGRMTSRTDSTGTAQWVYDTAAGAGIGKLAVMVGAPDPTFNGTCSVPQGVQGITSGQIAVKVYVYTALGELQEVDECADGTHFATQYQYDSAGRQSLIRYPAVGGSQLAVGYHYTSLGFLQYLTDESTDYSVLWQAKAMNALGQVTDQQTLNGVETVTTPNPSTGWMMGSTSTAHADGETVIQNWSTTYDEAGDLLTRSRTDAVSGAPSNETFGYDLLNRLTSSEVKIPTLTPAYDHQESYVYDTLGLGNLSTKNGSLYTYGTGCNGPAGPHAVCTVAGGPAYGYDSNGNMTSGGGRSVAYNSNNKPTQIQGESQGQAGTVNFAYGADGNRVLQVVNNGGATTRTVYAGLGATGKSLYERSTTGTNTPLHTFFIYAGSAIVGNAFAVRILNDNGTVAANRYFGFDHLGSTTIVTDENGHVATSTAGSADAGALGYDPWGARRSSDGEAATAAMSFPVASGHREFTGQETIPSIGLVNMNGRVYDPVLGRFLSPDPTIGSASDLQSYNRYSYVQNNPLSYTDPTGYTLFGSNWADAAVGIGIGLLGVAACAGTEGVGCTFFFAYLSTIYSATAAMSNGASLNQVLLGAAIGAGTGVLGGALGGSVAGAFTPSLPAQMLGGAIGGAASAAFSSLAQGHGLSAANILESAAIGATTAALSWGLTDHTPVDQATAAQSQEGEGAYYRAGSGAPRWQSKYDGHDLLVPIPSDSEDEPYTAFRLSPYAISVLKPIFDQYNFDLSQIEVDKVGILDHDTIGWTVGNTVHVDMDYWDESNNYGRLDLLAHEITHSVQYEQLGFVRFGLRYAAEFLDLTPNTSFAPHAGFNSANYDTFYINSVHPALNLETLTNPMWSLDQIANYTAEHVVRQ